MKALVLREHGGPEKAVYETDFPDPKLGRAMFYCACARRR